MYQHVPGAIDEPQQVEHLGRRKSARVTNSASFLAELSVSSPRKLFIFII